MMSKWKMVRLGDIGQIITGNTPKTSDSSNFDSNDISFFKPGDFFATGITPLFEAESFVSDNAKDKIRILPADSILVTCIGIIGKVGITRQVATCNQQINAILPNEKYDSRYVAYAIMCNRNQLNHIANAAVVPIVNKTQFSNLQIPLPPLPVQQQIADVLDRASALIEKRKAQIEKLDLLVKSQFVEMFGDPVTNPKGWDVKKLYELFDVGSSKRIYQRDLATEGVPFLRISDLVQRIKTGNCSNDQFISEELYSDFEKKSLVPKTDDILVTSRGTLGLCYVITDVDNFYFQDGMISWLKKKEPNINIGYITTLFTMNGFRKQIDEIPAGSTVNYLSIARLEKLDVMYPNPLLQSEFTDFTQSIKTQKSLLQQSLAKLEQNYKSLMQKCFRGEIF